MVRLSRPVAGRRPCLASSFRLPLCTERGSGACGATGDGRRARDARGACASRVVHHRRSRARALARAACALLILGFSLVRSPVVVFVSRLRFGRRSMRGEGPARAERRATCARRARRACIAGGLSPPQSSRGVARCGAVLLLGSSLVLSFAPHAPHLRSTHVSAGACASRISAQAYAECDAAHLWCLGVLSVRRAPRRVRLFALTLRSSSAATADENHTPAEKTDRDLRKGPRGEEESRREGPGAHRRATGRRVRRLAPGVCVWFLLVLLPR